MIVKSQVTLERKPVVVLDDSSRSKRSSTFKQTVLAGTNLVTVRVAADYKRYSTAARGERSETRQLELAASYAARLGVPLYKSYADRARTGSTMVSRSAIAEVLADAAAGKFDILIVEDIDRLSRAMTDSQSAYRRQSHEKRLTTGDHDREQ